MNKKSQINILFEKLLITSFAVIISIPFIFADKMGGISNSENRRLAMMPFINEQHELILNLEFTELKKGQSNGLMITHSEETIFMI